MMDQAKKLTIVSGIVFNDKTPLFYKKLKEVTGFESALQMNSGSEAVEAAIKIMRKWGYLNKKIQLDKAEIIVCEGNYHGRTTTIDSLSSERKRVEKF
jgi:ornithine--oxo-acid transaminase